MIGRAEIVRLGTAGRVDERTQERDYILTLLLWGMSEEDFGFVFKGGTCLRRCYFPGYRYSEDLDFSLVPGAPAVSPVEASSAWCRWIGAQAGVSADAIADAGAPEKRAWVSFTGPLGSRRERAIKIDLADEEDILDEIARMPLLSEYSDLPDRVHYVPAYTLAEIWAEKTRSLMQRAEPRDAYDLWRIAASDRHIPAAAHAIFATKARSKGLDPSTLDDRLVRREPQLEPRWEDRLRDQVDSVPPFKSTWRSVRRTLRQSGY